jgi:phage terminase large subunit-like protein
VEGRDRQDAGRRADAAGHEHAGVEPDRRHGIFRVYQKVATGAAIDDEAFAFIARVDEKDQATVFETPEVWTKSLPALGITFPRENIDGMVNTARSMLSTALSTKRLYFGIPVGTEGFWISEEAWNAVQGVVDELALQGRPCWLSLDLSKKNDLTALEGKLITAVDGAVIDKTFVAAEVKKLCAENDVQFLAFDPAGIADFIAACEQIGFPVWKWEGPDKPGGYGLKLVSHSQGKLVKFEDKQLTMPRSIERLEDRILAKSITIDSSAVTYSCAANAHLDSDGQANRAFDKKRSRGRIDGVVTIAMAVGAATNELGDSESVYEERGLTVL